MNDRKQDAATDAGRARAAKARKSADVESGATTAHPTKSRKGERHRIAPPPVNSVVTRSAAYVEPLDREAMIAESAYFRSAHRGFEPGHEVDDWLASEAEIDAALARGDLRGCGD